MDKLIAIPVMLVAGVLFTMLAYQMAPVLAAVGGIWGAVYLQERVKGYIAVASFILFPVLMLSIGFLILLILVLPASLIFGVPFLGYDIPSIFG